MTIPPSPLQTAPAPGLASSLRSLAASALDYGSARWRLLKAEAGDMSRSVLRAVLFGAVALFACASIYAISVIALTLWIARTWWQGDLLPSLLIVLSGNVIVAALAAFTSARCLSKKSFFHHTLEELQTDRQCLTHPPL